MHMRKQYTYNLLAGIILLACTTSALAESRYVVDTLLITVRTGQSTQHQILKTVPSSTKLELLETAENYSRVRTPDGTEGWVLNQYITDKPTAKLLLAAAETKAAKLSEENAKLKAELADVSGKASEVNKEHSSLNREYKKLTEEVTHLRAVAAKPLKLENENQQLKKQLLDLENAHELLRQENQVLSDSSDREWFLNGAGVIIVGIILGLIIPRLRTQKKSSWGSL